MMRLPGQRRLDTQRAIAFDQFMGFGGLAPDVVPEQEAVCMEMDDWVTTSQRHDHLHGQQWVVASIARSTGAWIG